MVIKEIGRDCIVTIAPFIFYLAITRFTVRSVTYI